MVQCIKKLTRRSSFGLYKFMKVVIAAAKKIFDWGFGNPVRIVKKFRSYPAIYCSEYQ